MEPHIRYIEKSVIIHRDESGFGFRVGGQNPVFVDCVHENGAAWKAGVRRFDDIIKVNGTLVRSYDHQRVVNMIQNCTPFVNLTLHSREPIIPVEAFSISPPIQTNNETLTNNQRLQSNNLNWLLDIGDDLFQDNLQQQQQLNIDKSISSPHQTSGVSKLIESGPNLLNASNSQSSFTGGVKLKIRQNRNQDSTRDNPYYYYKTVPEKSGLDVTMGDGADSSPPNQDPHNLNKLHHAPSSSSTTGKTLSSIVRSRSSGKITARASIISSKHKSRKLRSRLVGDFRSLTIANMQANPSSLSTSPSSSDLSDCDDTDINRPNLLSLNTSTQSVGSDGGPNFSNSAHTNATVQIHNIQSQKPKQTTRRLEIIRELVDTEKTHTERLKHLNDLLYKPIKAEGLVPIDQLKMIFSCHKSLFKIHRKIYKILTNAQRNVSDHHQDPLIGRALIEIFEGELGKRLEKAASSFCACQSINTELLNRITRKDTKAGEFLAQVATQQMLGRLGIKDLLASCFQRLTKYPLLLDNLLKATPATSDERLCISRALQSSRQILTHVNEAVNKAISLNRLRDLWKKADKSANLPDIDIDAQKIIHEGPLTLSFNRRSFDVYVMLLANYLVILTREGQDKFKLKHFTSEGKTPNQQLSPIFTIDEHLATRDLATDKNGFYVLCKSKNDSRIYQFASQSPDERTKWKEMIHMVQQYNFPVVPDDENTLTRYRELITLTTSSNTPNNIEQHSQQAT